MPKILVLHGPNLNLLGTREPQIYSSVTLTQLNERLVTQAANQDFDLECKQTNAEHELIEMIQMAPATNTAAIILNAAGYAHTSVALRDAMLAVRIPFIEVHISNTYARESFRAHSYLSDIAAGVIIGLGPIGYELALTAVIKLLINKSQQE